VKYFETKGELGAEIVFELDELEGWKMIEARTWNAGKIE